MKKWLLNRFLPLWAKQTLLLDNRLLRQENEVLKQRVRVLEAYTEGMRAGMKHCRRTHSTEVKNG